MTQYIYDMKYGHYRPLNEDDNSMQTGAEQTGAQQTNQTQDNQNNQEQNNKASLQNLETADVLKVKQEKTNKLKDADNIILQKNNNIIQMQQQLNKALESGQPTNELQRKLLQAQKDLIDAKFNKSKIEHDMDDKIIQAQLTVVESIILDSFPTRYQKLNEEQINQSKIYLNTLISSDPLHIINEMADFKKIMCRANLLYGKDANGYFAVCVDSYDLNRFSAVLERAGYLKESINACCYSQLYL